MFTFLFSEARRPWQNIYSRILVHIKIFFEFLHVIWVCKFLKILLLRQLGQCSWLKLVENSLHCRQQQVQLRCLVPYKTCRHIVFPSTVLERYWFPVDPGHISQPCAKFSDREEYENGTGHLNLGNWFSL